MLTYMSVYSKVIDGIIQQYVQCSLLTYMHQRAPVIYYLCHYASLYGSMVGHIMNIMFDDIKENLFSSSYRKVENICNEG